MSNIGKKTKDNETKREKFVRLVESRMNNTLKNIELLSNLSNTSNYEYNYDDVNKIIRTLRNAINDLEYSFKIDKKNKKFSL